MHFPFYAEEYQQDATSMEPWELSVRSRHAETAVSFEDYRRQCKFDFYAKRGMQVYNVVQTSKPTDEKSRIFLGMTRAVIDRGHELMTEGEPMFSFEPKGKADQKLLIIWESLIENILSDCNYRVHQNVGFKDLLTMGSVVFEQYIDYPQRSVLIPNESEETGYETVIIRDFTQPQVGLRAVSPLDAWRNPNVPSTTIVGSCWKREVYGWNQFAVDFGNMLLQDGERKYKHLFKIKKGSHVAVFVYQDEYTGEYAKYAVGFGNDEDSFSQNVPDLSAVSDSIQIFYKPLKIHEIEREGKMLRSDGLNIPGKCSLRWGTYFDAYDRNYRGTHSVYGMGLPQRIEAEDMTMQMIYNTNIDNFRWTNSVVLNYEGNHADSYLDVDANRFIGGELVDGKITPMPLGISRINDYRAIKEDIEDSVISGSGINHRSITGDTSKTAFEFAQRIKLATRSAEQTVSRLETELFAPLGELLLGAAITELTVSEYENITGKQAAEFSKMISDRKMTTEDFMGLNTDKPKRRIRRYIRVKGHKIREDFTSSKRRNLDYDSPYQTLIYDSHMESETSFIPLVEQYVTPHEFKETGVLPRTIVDSKRMLGDRKARDAQNMKLFYTFLIEAAQIGIIDPKRINTDEFIREFAEFTGVDRDKALKEEKDESDALKAARLTLEKLKNIRSPILNAEKTPVSIPDVGGAAPVPQRQEGIDNALVRTAEGRL